MNDEITSENLDRLFAEAEQIFTDARDQLSREDYQKFLAEILVVDHPGES